MKIHRLNAISCFLIIIISYFTCFLSGSYTVRILSEAPSYAFFVSPLSAQLFA